MHRLLMLGLNHATAPLAVREQLAFGSEQRQKALADFRTRFSDVEAVLLSTCNRVELYVAGTDRGRPDLDRMIDFLAGFHGLPAERFRPHLYHKTGRDVVSHLFSVASSLDSMVVGETQILGQVREAYDVSREQSAAGLLLNPLFQRALAVGKEVMRDTPLGEGRLSIAGVAVDYARRIFDHFDDKTILCIGAGEMASLVLRHFTELRPGQLLVCNRNGEKAAILADRFNGHPAPFEDLSRHLVAADIVISGTASTEPIVTKSRFDPLRRQRRYRPIFFIDIALPRDVEAGVGELENVYLYNVDDLQQVVAATRTQRTGAVDAAAKIVADHVERFIIWHGAREMGPVIDQLYQRCHDVARQELARTLNKLPDITDVERAHLEELTRRIVNKMLHGPIQTLRHSGSRHTPVAPYVHALEKLFQLDGNEQK